MKAPFSRNSAVLETDSYGRNFPDSMTANLDSKHLSNHLITAFAPELASSSSKSAPKATIDALITFDAQGISSHPNHISLYHGARTFLQTLMQKHSGWECRGPSQHSQSRGDPSSSSCHVSVTRVLPRYCTTGAWGTYLWSWW